MQQSAWVCARNGLPCPCQPQPPANTAIRSDIHIQQRNVSVFSRDCLPCPWQHQLLGGNAQRSAGQKQQPRARECAHHYWPFHCQHTPLTTSAQFANDHPPQQRAWACILDRRPYLCQRWPATRFAQLRVDHSMQPKPAPRCQLHCCRRCLGRWAAPNMLQCSLSFHCQPHRKTLQYRVQLARCIVGRPPGAPHLSKGPHASAHLLHIPATAVENSVSPADEPHGSSEHPRIADRCLAAWSHATIRQMLPLSSHPRL
mmetsp:Transcript_125473/g.297972  ORF Transcript_125473/g.297972 Transcript_125473/m.297972 type:complete len:257 (+) Transcript_125473:1-771(+)